jgi:hypothetical protein
MPWSHFSLPYEVFEGVPPLENGTSFKNLIWE